MNTPTKTQLNQQIYYIVAEMMELGQELDPYQVLLNSSEYVMTIHYMIEDLQSGIIDSYIESMNEIISNADDEDTAKAAQNIVADLVDYKNDYEAFKADSLPVGQA